jgi:hypothetical protein
MEPARGDQRRCTCPGCTGTMRYGRESENAAAQPQPRSVQVSGDDEKGWICSKDPAHFTRAAERPLRASDAA